MLKKPMVLQSNTHSPPGMCSPAAAKDLDKQSVYVFMRYVYEGLPPDVIKAVSDVSGACRQAIEASQRRLVPLITAVFDNDAEEAVAECFKSDAAGRSLASRISSMGRFLCWNEEDMWGIATHVFSSPEPPAWLRYTNVSVFVRALVHLKQGADIELAFTSLTAIQQVQRGCVWLCAAVFRLDDLLVFMKTKFNNARYGDVVLAMDVHKLANTDTSVRALFRFVVELRHSTFMHQHNIMYLIDHLLLGAARVIANNPDTDDSFRNYVVDCVRDLYHGSTPNRQCTYTTHMLLHFILGTESTDSIPLVAPHDGSLVRRPFCESVRVMIDAACCLVRAHPLKAMLPAVRAVCATIHSAMRMQVGEPLLTIVDARMFGVCPTGVSQLEFQVAGVLFSSVSSDKCARDVFMLLRNNNLIRSQTCAFIPVFLLQSKLLPDILRRVCAVVESQRISVFDVAAGRFGPNLFRLTIESDIEMARVLSIFSPKASENHRVLLWAAIRQCILATYDTAAWVACSARLFAVIDAFFCKQQKRGHQPPPTTTFSALDNTVFSQWIVGDEGNDRARDVVAFSLLDMLQNNRTDKSAAKRLMRYAFDGTTPSFSSKLGLATALVDVVPGTVSDTLLKYCLCHFFGSDTVSASPSEWSNFLCRVWLASKKKPCICERLCQTLLHAQERTTIQHQLVFLCDLCENAHVLRLWLRWVIGNNTVFATQDTDVICDTLSMSRSVAGIFRMCVQLCTQTDFILKMCIADDVAYRKLHQVIHWCFNRYHNDVHTFSLLPLLRSDNISFYHPHLLAKLHLPPPC